MAVVHTTLATALFFCGGRHQHKAADNCFMAIIQVTCVSWPEVDTEGIMPQMLQVCRIQGWKTQF